MIEQPRICVQVHSIYVETQSIPEEERFVFAYTVTVRNLGRSNVQLLGRYWLITNSNGRQTEVQGEGLSANNHLSCQVMNFNTPAVPFWKLRWVLWKDIMK